MNARDELAHEIALIMAEHHRINPPGGKCTCGHETGLGQLVTRHIADAVLASGLVVPAERLRLVRDSVREVSNERAAERDRLAAQVAAVRALCDRHEKWPIDDELSGYVPIDEVRAALEVADG